MVCSQPSLHGFSFRPHQKNREFDNSPFLAIPQVHLDVFCKRTQGICPFIYLDAKVWDSEPAKPFTKSM